jgi:hypothetical protein
MNDPVDTATRCSCGRAVSISDEGAPRDKRWAALCYHCYDGTEDAVARAHVIGRGATPHDALWAWQDMHDEAWEVEWHLADLPGEIAQQVSIEAERQRGWTKRCRGTGDLPEHCPRERRCELIYGPETTP